MSEVVVATKATKATLPFGDEGICASHRIKRATGGELATTYPPKITITICIVNGVSPQKPSPKSLISSDQDDPQAQPARNTKIVMSRTKVNASGNQRSIKTVNVDPSRASTPPPFVGLRKTTSELGANGGMLTLGWTPWQRNRQLVLGHPSQRDRCAETPKP